MKVGELHQHDAKTEIKRNMVCTFPRMYKREQQTIENKESVRMWEHGLGSAQRTNWRKHVHWLHGEN